MLYVIRGTSRICSVKYLFGLKFQLAGKFERFFTEQIKSNYRFSNYIAILYVGKLHSVKLSNKHRLATIKSNILHENLFNPVFDFFICSVILPAGWIFCELAGNVRTDILKSHPNKNVYILNKSIIYEFFMK